MQQQATFINTDKPQPPRPESRSDSFARADALLREHRQLQQQQQQQQQQQLVAASNSHTDQKQSIGQIDFVSTLARNSRPESRNRIVACQSVSRTTVTSNDRSTDHVDAGLLTMVDQQSNARTSADPLVSLIQSLAEISPTYSPQSMTNNVKSDTSDHHHASINAATATTARSNIVNLSSTNCSPNQSPKAWQNCTQVCPASSRRNPRCSSICIQVVFLIFLFFATYYLCALSLSHGCLVFFLLFFFTMRGSTLLQRRMDDILLACFSWNFLSVAVPFRINFAEWKRLMLYTWDKQTRFGS